MSKKNILMITIGASLGLASIASITLTAVSCNESTSNSNNVSNNISNDAYELYNEFVTSTHGRWAGNYANFIPKDSEKRADKIDEHTFGQYGLNSENLSKAGFNNITNPKEQIKLTFDKTKKINESDPDGIGSHYAYDWLVQKIKSFGFNDLGGDYSVSNEDGTPNFPKEATVKITKNNNGKEVVSVEKVDGIKLLSNGEGRKNIAIIKDQINTKSYFQEKGFITQGYLWNGNDLITKKPVANQYGQNIIVTIKALNEDGTPKFSKINSIDNLNNAERTAFWITSHYDSTGNQGIDSKSWGATDNGSGVGATLDLIKYYSQEKNAKTLECDLNIAFVGSEEVGVTGSTALVGQFFSNDGANKIHCAQIGGMLNLDTAAGGDNVYVHSPWTNLYELNNNKLILSDTQVPGAATSTLIRDQLNAISKMQADSYNDKNAELQIHPFITPIPNESGYLQGQTGDWSDHASFYKTGISNVAYIEATNFQINGNSGYDGYSQTINPIVWSLKKEKKISNEWKDCLDENGKLITKPVKVIQSQLENQSINVWGPDESELKEFNEGDNTYRWARNNSGAIWHWDFDRPDFMNQNFPNRMNNQLTNLGATLRTFFTILNISTFNNDLDNKNENVPSTFSTTLSLLKEYNIPTYVLNNSIITYRPLKIMK